MAAKRPKHESAGKEPTPLTKNRLLTAMSPADRTLLEPDMREVALPLRYDLELPNTVIRDIYFIDHGVASVVAVSDRNTKIEVGLIGCEGSSGTAVVLDSDRSPHHTYMQIGGGGFKISVSAFKAAVDSSASLQKIMLRYAQAFGFQTTHTAVANGRATLEQRLARWILMAYDRVPKNPIPLTHEFLSVMLGVRRAGVTDNLRALSKRGLIHSPKLGLIEIVDRDGLEKIAGTFYGVPEREYDRLLN